VPGYSAPDACTPAPSHLTVRPIFAYGTSRFAIQKSTVRVDTRIREAISNFVINCLLLSFIAFFQQEDSRSRLPSFKEPISSCVARHLVRKKGRRSTAALVTCFLGSVIPLERLLLRSNWRQAS
jgi:hypothetical protein